MIRATALPRLFVLVSAPGAAEDRSLVPTLEDHPDVCPEQPAEPAWMRNLPARDAHKRLLVQQIYRAQSMERIIDAQACSCPTRYPPWDAAGSVYFDRYAAADYWAIVEATSGYRRKANALRLKAMPICKAAGNW
mgnify:CR=1 FL=1